MLDVNAINLATAPMFSVDETGVVGYSSEMFELMVYLRELDLVERREIRNQLRQQYGKDWRLHYMTALMSQGKSGDEYTLMEAPLREMDEEIEQLQQQVAALSKRLDDAYAEIGALKKVKGP